MSTPSHSLAVICESSSRNGKYRHVYKVHVRGGRGGTHAILLTSAYYDEGDRRLPFVKSALHNLVKELAPHADHLCSCPPPKN